MVIALPLTQVLYQRGAFTAEDSFATAIALAIYGAGLPAFVLHKVLQPLYYAREDTRRPFRYALWSMVLNAALALGLMPVIGFAAAALATSLSAWIMALQLWWGARAMGPEAHFDLRMMTNLPRILLACAAMAAVLWGAALALQPLLQSPGWRYPSLALLIGLGMTSYFGAGLALKAFSLSDFKTLRRRGS